MTLQQNELVAQSEKDADLSDPASKAIHSPFRQIVGKGRLVGEHVHFFAFCRMSQNPDRLISVRSKSRFGSGPHQLLRPSQVTLPAGSSQRAFSCPKHYSREEVHHTVVDSDGMCRPMEGPSRERRAFLMLFSSRHNFHGAEWHSILRIGHQGPAIALILSTDAAAAVNRRGRFALSPLIAGG